MSAVLDRPESLLPGRFEYLMGLYAENYHRLVRLFAPHKLAAGEYVSSVDDGLDVRLKIQEKHPYTVELELTYAFVDAETGQPSPSAQLRMYTDAHVAEALHCHPGRRLWQVLGPVSPGAHRAAAQADDERVPHPLAGIPGRTGSFHRHPGTGAPTKTPRPEIPVQR